MGWSGYELGTRVACLVDCHGGEAEKRGEALYAELAARVHEAVRVLIEDPKYEEINPIFI